MQHKLAVISQIFQASMAAQSASANLLGDKIVRAAEILITAIKARQKILTCGNGGSAADAQHFSSEMLNRFERDRAGFAALALTTDASTVTSIANDYDFSQIFSKQITALGRAGDVLLTFSTSGVSPNIVRAIEAAHSCEMQVILVTGKDGGGAARALHEADIELRVPNSSTARIQEVHLTILHCLCELIDGELIGEKK
jgi:D-sedoheptulose 7-phosphate isomerase